MGEKKTASKWGPPFNVVFLFSEFFKQKKKRGKKTWVKKNKNEEIRSGCNGTLSHSLLFANTNFLWGGLISRRWTTYWRRRLFFLYIIFYWRDDWMSHWDRSSKAAINFTSETRKKNWFLVCNFTVFERSESTKIWVQITLKLVVECSQKWIPIFELDSSSNSEMTVEFRTLHVSEV